MPLYAAGQRIRGSEINALPQLYRVTTDQSNNTASLINCAGLAFTGEVNAAYLVECFLFYSAKVAADIAVQWTVPSGGSGYWGASGTESGSGSGAVGQGNRQALAIPTGLHAFNGDDGILAVYADPVASITLTNPGTVQLQFRQLTVSAGNPTLIRAGSAIRVSRLG
jgi:hypothetical protein